ncbi:MAG TPA: NADH-quinone oxidoreductase subunit L [Candidatus Acidoferrales bacterium]|jgi:NADH-quinone oxidoreductase subunit L|nr:NADH-quinone oxidoreductase subunit L [Candidatus Acidoferrales bacterium]
MPVLTYLWIIPLLPLLGATANGIFGASWPKNVTTAIALSSTALAFFAALEAVREFFTLSPEQIPYVKTFFTWISAGGFQADFALQVDQLTVIMLLVVTGVGWLIHIYSSGYMHDDPGYRRFFSYLNLFMFFMLILILASNYLLMFVGWEGVGLCSYLLIGFFFLKQSATNAGNKAFWVNRIGDFGFLLGVLLIFKTFGSLNFTSVLPAAVKMSADPAGQIGTLTTIALLLFVGAAGKSAQLPLYVWLPDAMEGPTPVSALIHAATMVTAGVYMVVRSHAIFLNAPVAMQLVAIVGCLTALFAATIGLVQTDIKKVLAYSTVSQLGYMFLACGVGAFGAGVFHLMTHAFFKGLLFLAAGSVIHAMGGEQDMRKMGGLRTKIPITFWTMLMGTLAIAGIPGFSGFFSKDEILGEALRVSPVLGWLGVFAAGLTSFYMFRLIFLTFFGTQHYDEHHVHVHESPSSMTIPLIVLAILSVAGGWMAAPQFFGGVNHFEHFLEPVLSAAAGPVAEGPQSATGGPGVLQALMGAPVIAGLLGLLLAWWMYIQSPETPEKLSTSLSGPYKLLYGKYFIDEIYQALIVSPLVWISRNVLWHVVDEKVIDGTVNGVATVSRESGDRLRHANTGNIRSYATWIALGVVVFTTLLLWMVD